jgi:hypothetical protein
MLTLDEDNSNEIDYIEFATSGVAGNTQICRGRRTGSHLPGGCGTDARHLSARRRGEVLRGARPERFLR